MTGRGEQPLLQRPQSYPSRVVDGLRLWNEARRAAHHEDSIFIWIPKNAGTSVHNMLRGSGLVKLNTTRSIRLCFGNSGRVTFGHIAVGSLVDLGIVSRDFAAGAFKFALSRDPYSRAVSLYRYLSSIDVLKNWHERPSFRDFLSLLADGYFDRIGAYNQRGLSQANPQVAWLKDASPDKIYRVEDLGGFVDDISERWGIPKREIPHMNQSGGRTEFEVSREEKLLIEKIYAEDFEALGYAKR